MALLKSPPIPPPDGSQVERAIRLTYAQMMLNAVFGASTGGMFLVGFAIDLGANNVLLGLASTVPQYFVLFQLLAAYLVERGISRKRLTVAFAFLTPLCWFLVAAVPFSPMLGRGGRIAVLIGVIALVTLSAQFAANARASWLGDLIPAERRGRFFGYCSMFSGIVGAFFAIVEGRFLDVIRSRGLWAFTALFFFGALFGLASASLNMPQADCPLPGRGASPFLGRVREAFRNRPFVRLALVHAVMALGGVAGPFAAAYCLRDVGLSFFGLGLLNAVSTAALLVMSPVWGRLVDRFGCRPVMVLGLVLMAPCAAVWLLIPPGARSLAYVLLPWTNFISGTGSAAFSVAVITMMYKTSRPEGRAVQFASYNIFVTLVGAPMPVLGGWLVSHLAKSGFAVDLRITFYLWAVFVFAAALLARRLKEPGSMPVRALLLGYFPDRVARLWESAMSVSPFFTSQVRSQGPNSGRGGARQECDQNRPGKDEGQDAA